MIRKPIITVLGHVDHGKTTFLDSVRGTIVAEKEVGRITQHIGATEVPIEAIKKIAGQLIAKYGFSLKIPGLLFVDTPGHEAFTNLRKRGGSIADLAVIVVDCMQGCQKQTIEAVDIVKTFKTPFLVAFTKIDMLQGWDSRQGSFLENQKNQSEEVRKRLDDKLYELVGKLYEKGFNAERFDRVEDFTKQVVIVPISAKTGEGIPEILLFLAGLSQKYLEQSLEVNAEAGGKASILEVKEEKGLGKTVDVILYEGTLMVGEKIVFGSNLGVSETKIRAILVPKPLEEISCSKEKFKPVKEVTAAAGIKIAAPLLESALAGSPLRAVVSGKEAEEIKSEISGIMFESEAVGPIVKADALGSLEAVVKMLEQQGIKVHSASVGDVSRKDIMEAAALKEKDSLKSIVFAFNTRLGPGASEEIQKFGVQVFEEQVIYKLVEDYTKWVEEEKQRQMLAAAEKIVFPAKIVVLKGFVFRNSKPAIVGVKVLCGKIRAGVRVFGKKGIIGKIDAIQSKGKTLKEASEGEEVAVALDGAVVGRNLFEEDELFAFIPKSHFFELEKVKDCLKESDLELLEEIRKKQEKLEDKGGE